MEKATSQPEPEFSDPPPPGWSALPPAPDIPSKRDMTRDEQAIQELIVERGKQSFVEVGARQR